MDILLEDMPECARAFVACLPQKPGTTAHAVGLKGDLGAGKTTFVQEVAKALGVTERVTSPTFVLVQRYKINHPVFSHLVHIDAYRLEDEAGDTFGLADYLADPSNLVLVEWPEHIPQEAGLPGDASTLHFETINETTRRITRE